MKKRKLPSPRVLRRLLSYDPETGELTWKERPVWLGKPGNKTISANVKGWNTKYAGKPAFTAPDPAGHLRGNILRTCCLAHRVAWAIHHGEWPSDQIDHINGDPSDNRIVNLRDVDQLTNCKNVSLRSDNSSGRVGVGWYPKREKWRARICVNKRQMTLGYFDSFDEAVAAREVAEARHDFHPNHGRN